MSRKAGGLRPGLFASASAEGDGLAEARLADNPGASWIQWTRSIPFDWPVMKLRHLLHRVEQGWSPQAEAREPLETEWGVLKLNAVSQGKFNPSAAKALPLDVEPMTQYEVRPGDFLVTRANTPTLVGDVCFVRETRPMLMLCDLIYRIELRRELVDGSFLAYFLGSRLGRHQIEADARGSSGSMVKVSQEHIKDWLAPLPPLSAQRAIATYLDAETARIDALIAAKENMLAVLAEKRRAVITQAVTRGLDPSVPMRDSGVPWLGEVPAHWEVTRLKFVADVQSGFALGKKYDNEPLAEYPYLRVANVQDGFLDLTEVKTIEVSHRDAQTCQLRPGDVLMNEGGDADKLGRGAIWRGEIDPCLHQNHVFAVRPRQVASDWLNLWTCSEGAKGFFGIMAKQSTNLASISATNLKELPIPKPPMAEQFAIVQHVDTELSKFDACVGATELTIQLLRERRAAIITAAVTGQLNLGA